MSAAVHLLCFFFYHCCCCTCSSNQIPGIVLKMVDIELNHVANYVKIFVRMSEGDRIFVSISMSPARQFVSGSAPQCSLGISRMTRRFSTCRSLRRNRGKKIRSVMVAIAMDKFFI
jgi:hypothetical protein